MIINNAELLKLSPIKNMLPGKLRHNGVSHGLGEAGYDIRIKQDVVFIPTAHGMGFCVDNGPLSYGTFVITSAIEEFQMPSTLVGVVHDKSTWARKGLSVFNTVIESGWNGWLTLELVYHGSQKLHIPAGSGIAQVLFSQLSEPTAYEGKYQNQPDEPVNAIFTD